MTALGAAVAAGSALGVWQLGTKMENISVYRYCRWNILLNLFYVTYLFQTVVQRSVIKIILGILVIMIFVGQEDGDSVRLGGTFFVPFLSTFSCCGCHCAPFMPAS